MMTMPSTVPEINKEQLVLKDDSPKKISSFEACQATSVVCLDLCDDAYCFFDNV